MAKPAFRRPQALPNIPLSRMVLQRQHPLAPGLAFYIICQGGKAIDLCTGAVGTPSGTFTEASVRDGRGSGMAAASSAYFDFGHKTEWSLTTAVSLVWRGVLDSDPGGTTSRCVVFKAATDLGFSTRCSFHTAGALRFVRCTGGDFRTMGGPSSSTGTLKTYGVASPTNPANCNFYVDGAGSAGSSLAGGATSSADSSRSLMVGRFPFTSNSGQFDGKTTVVIGWGRELSAREMLMVHLDMYSLIADKRDRRALFTGTSPPPPPPSNNNYFMPLLGVGDD